jgi:hypothetical protein
MCECYNLKHTHICPDGYNDTGPAGLQVADKRRETDEQRATDRERVAGCQRARERRAVRDHSKRISEAERIGFLPAPPLLLVVGEE